jgi:hypothetical protein
VKIKLLFHKKQSFKSVNTVINLFKQQKLHIMKLNLSKINFGVMISMGIVFFLFTSCEKIKKATAIDVKYDLPDSYFTLDSVSLLKAEKLLYSETFTANIDSILSANGGSLQNVSFYQVRLSVVSPTWVTFNWLTSARATITPQGGSPIEIATTTNVNSIARSVDFDIKNLDVASSVNGPFVLNIYGNLSGPIPVNSVQMLLESGIKISVSPL